MVTLFYPSEGFRTAEKNFTIAFFLPFEFQACCAPCIAQFLHHRLLVLELHLCAYLCVEATHNHVDAVGTASLHCNPHRAAAPADVVDHLLVPTCHTLGDRGPCAQDDPPKPRDRLIVTHPSPASKMYVSSFGGFATQQGVLSEAAKLQEAVKEDGNDVLTRALHTEAFATTVMLRFAKCTPDTLVGSCE